MKVDAMVGRHDLMPPYDSGAMSGGAMGSSRPTDVACDGAMGSSRPTRKRMNHRGPLSIDVSAAWYFITICAEGHAPWAMPVGRDDLIAPKSPYDAILSTARHFQKIGKWFLSLFLVMPDHLHFIVRIPGGAMGSSRPTGLERVIRDFKRSISRLFKIRFQRDFFDTRLRDDAHFAEKYNYILGNPVRKGLCAEPSDWHHVIAFSRETGVECGVCGGAMGASRPTDDGAMVGRHDPMPPHDSGDVAADGAMGSSRPTECGMMGSSRHTNGGL